jgi:DNA-binding CsgD family transcriptional regulator/tetratricopeptide (TPR) repeat protein
VARRVSSSTFVGRSAELAELEAALADAAAGHPSLAFVAGESGVGKTRLLGELAAHAQAQGARVLSGDCVDLGEGELPYAPLVGALRGLVRSEDPVLGELPPTIRAELTTLLPDLGRGPSAGGDATAQSRLFEALLWLLDRLGQAAPVLLAIEDLHWADRPTRSFVAFLGGTLSEERVLVVSTYRSDELHRRHPLRPLLAELERDTRSRRIELEPLSREELVTQLAGILGAPPAGDLVERVFARSEGYPLFVEELLAASLDGRGALPPTLRDALMLRAERLAGGAQAVLRVIAVGEPVDDEVLAEVSGLEAATLHEALREGLTNHILAVRPDGRYRFRHALLREVVRDDLLPGERAGLELRVGRALEARAEREGLGVYLAVAIAHHYDAAGDQPAALRSAVRAAGEAERVHAYRQAAHLLERAVELFDRVEDAEALAGADRAELLARAAEDHRLDGDITRQESFARAALALLDERAEPRKVARVLETLADAEWHLGRAEQAVATRQHAFSLLPADDVSPERASLAARRAKGLMLRGRLVHAESAAREALGLADALGDRALRAESLDALGSVLMSLGRVDEGAATLREAVELAREEGALGAMATAYVNLADDLHLAGRLREARAVADEAATFEPRTNHPWLLTLRGELAIEAGDWDDAERIFAQIRRHPVGNALVNLDLRRAELALGRGDHDAARTLLDEAAGIAVEMDEPQFTVVLGALRAELERRAGDLAEAAAAVQDVLARVESTSEDAARLARLSAVGATVEADTAQRARDLGEAAAEHTALAHADGHVARAEAAAAREGPLELAWLLQARAERTRAAGSPDPSAYAAAAEAWSTLERPYPAAVLRLREAEAHVAAGDRDAARTAASAARATAARLGAGWLRSEIDGLAARARLDLGVGGDGAGPAAEEPEVAADDPFGLTPRERQVLVLVARGATNREIGADLFMSEKTASVHVSRILAKLDVRSRTEAAGVAVRFGLAE